MTTWGLIGAGHIGGTVARLALTAGDDVLVSHRRGPESLADLVRELGPHARAVTTEEAARLGDVVVLSIPLGAVSDVPAQALSQRVVVDTSNYYPARDGAISTLDDGSTTSSELVQAALPGARVVKAFNTIQFSHLAALARPTGDPQRSALPIAGDDDGAKRLVRDQLDRIGYDTVDAGPLAEGRRMQPGTPAYGAVYAADPGDPSVGARPAPARVVSDALAAFSA